MTPEEEIERNLTKSIKLLKLAITFLCVSVVFTVVVAIVKVLHG